MSPRARKHNPTIPKHIDQAKLPTGLYWDASGRGRWYVLELEGGKRRARTIATAGAKLSELHAIIEDRGGCQRGTLSYLLGQFHGSKTFKELAERTRSDYEKYRKAVAALPTKAGKLGDLIVARLSLPFMQRLFDSIAEQHPTKANHLLRYLRRCFAWGMTRGLCQANPCKGAEAATEAKAARVPELVKLSAVLAFAKAAGALPPHSRGSVPGYLWIVMELAYLCRLRPVEAVTLTDAHHTPDGIRTNRRKGSRDVVVAWSPRLRAAWDAAVALRAKATADRPVPMRPEARVLIVGEDGSPLRRSSLDSAWQRMMLAAVNAGVIADAERFGMHAMKHRGITDTAGTRHEKRQASGHKSDAMMDVYDHSVPLVEPTSAG